MSKIKYSALHNNEDDAEREKQLITIITSHDRKQKDIIKTIFLHLVAFYERRRDFKNDTDFTKRFLNLYKESTEKLSELKNKTFNFYKKILGLHFVTDSIKHLVKTSKKQIKNAILFIEQHFKREDKIRSDMLKRREKSNYFSNHGELCHTAHAYFKKVLVIASFAIEMTFPFLEPVISLTSMLEEYLYDLHCEKQGTSNNQELERLIDNRSDHIITIDDLNFHLTHFQKDKTFEEEKTEEIAKDIMEGKAREKAKRRLFVVLGSLPFFTKQAFDIYSLVKGIVDGDKQSNQDNTIKCGL